jgi:hypothetical protein
MIWGQPIELVGKTDQSRLTITGLAMALEWLLQTRSSSSKPRLHAAAIDACLAEMAGQTPQARVLFIRAARAAGVLVETAHWRN